MGKNKIRAKLVEPATPIKAAALGDDCITLSFKHLRPSHHKFSYESKPSTYFSALLARLRELCSITHHELIGTHRKAFRHHAHNWRETSEPKGFCLGGQLDGIPGCQFQITSNAHGRVHGFFIGTTFFVVWLDPDHALYP